MERRGKHSGTPQIGVTCAHIPKRAEKVAKISVSVPCMEQERKQCACGEQIRTKVQEGRTIGMRGWGIYLHVPRWHGLGRRSRPDAWDQTTSSLLYKNMNNPIRKRTYIRV